MFAILKKKDLNPASLSAGKSKKKILYTNPFRIFLKYSKDGCGANQEHQEVDNHQAEPTCIGTFKAIPQLRAPLRAMKKFEIIIEPYKVCSRAC